MTVLQIGEETATYEDISLEDIEQCLSDARDYLETNGITRGSYLGQDMRCCSLGALGYASALYPFAGSREQGVFRAWTDGLTEYRLYLASQRVLEEAVGEDRSVSIWNDTNDDETILGGFAKAIQWVRDYRAKQQGASA